ncbi:hypothetical protein F7725_002227 [Dissostichus mawsoni]|uniref:Uncharacterized protein n=1 Tax=Dissostichus mawsoni TaxID=36200 RepID=A0A7J5Y4Y5_DISMA|nr:hypothetical protein F7725_002227 [Dissostichus mawsoni]
MNAKEIIHSNDICCECGHWWQIFTAQMIVQDDLFEAKLNFFLMVAREVTPFLKLYQTDNRCCHL